MISHLLEWYRESAKSSWFWLLAIASTLIIIQLSLFIKLDEGRLFESFILFGGAIVYLVWEQYKILQFNSSRSATIFGSVLIVFCLLKSTTLVEYDPFLRLVPLITFLGLALIASGFKGILQFRKELLMICFFIPAPSTVSKIFDISPWSANLGETILYYLGIQVARDGVFIYVLDGGVEVYYGCSGIESMVHLLGLSVLLLALFPTNWIRKIYLPLVAMMIAFFVNGFRIALLAVLSSDTSKAAFDFWHEGEGSLIFSLISVFVFGLFYYYYIYEQDFTDSSKLRKIDD